MKVCALGLYDRAIKQPGYHWDGQLKAFKELGIDYLALDVMNYKNEQQLISQIVEYDPDIIWIGHKFGLKLWCEIKKQNLLPNALSLYWMCDCRKIEGIPSKYYTEIKEPRMDPSDLNELVDYVFIAEDHRIDEYKQGFNTDNVYFMPQACTPSIIHRYTTKETYDIMFAGSIKETWAHKGREKIINELSKIYKVNVVKDDKINTPLLYSQARLALGMSSYNYYLVMSNRFFIGLGCGTCMMFQYFPGIERMVLNHVHMVWWKTVNELKDNIKYYLNHPVERNIIRKNAELLGHEKHTYVNRINNILDIIDNKTVDFYGFFIK